MFYFASATVHKPLSFSILEVRKVFKTYFQSNSMVAKRVWETMGLKDVHRKYVARPLILKKKSTNILLRLRKRDILSVAYQNRERKNKLCF